jgi:metal-responsive CopG/Arc/MetJ family transcriptional regulator
LGVKTAISIPDELFSKVEELARTTGKSRSQLFREALIEYLLRRDPEEITRSMDEALADIEDQNDRWLGEAGRDTLQRSEW